MSIPNADFDDKNDDHVRDRQHKVNGMEYSKHIYVYIWCPTRTQQFLIKSQCVQHKSVLKPRKPRENK